MVPTVDVIAIGHLSCNPHWNETEPVRPPLATCSLVRSGEEKILVDPSVPGELLLARLHERSGLTASRIDTVFLTCFHPTHRRGLHVLDDARWLMGAAELEAVTAYLNRLLEEDPGAPRELIDAELALLGRIEPAPDVPAEGVHLYPSPGATVGLCALLVAGLQTTIIAGDAVLTREHFERNQISENAADAERAVASLAEIYEVADIVVPGHDNLIVTPGGI